MKEAVIWLTYDMGVGGDFQGIYSWLDDNEAIECGNNVAFFNYSYPEGIDTDDALAEHLKSELESKIDFKPGNRVYIIRKSLDKKRNGGTIGRFIIGKRKANQWEGFGTKSENSLDE